MKLRILTSIIAIFLYSIAFTSAQTKDHVEVSATAQRDVIPNKIEVSIILNEEDSKGKISIKEQQNNLAQALKNAGIDAKNALVIESQSSSAAKRKNTYQYINYTLTLTSAEELEIVFDEFKALGVAQASVRSVSNDNVAAIAEELRAEAMKKAQKAAQSLAAAVDQKIGKAIMIKCYSVTDEASSYSGGMYLRSNARMDSAESVSLPEDLTIRPIELRQSVTVEFELL